MRPKVKSKSVQHTPTGTPTILSMFKKQTEKLESKLSHIASNLDCTLSDDDVEIVKVEAVSPYFNKSKSETSSCASSSKPRNTTFKKSLSLKTDKKKGRLSLNKSNICDDIKCGDDEVNTCHSHQSEHNASEGNYKISPLKGKYYLNKSNMSPKRQKYSPQKTDVGEGDSTSVFSVKGNSRINIKIIDNNSQEPPPKKHCKEQGVELNENVKVKMDNASVHINADVGQKKPASDEMLLGNNKCDNDDSDIFPEPLTAVNDPCDEDKHENSSNTIIDGDNSTYKVPYYLNNFEAILKSVLEDDSNEQLFNSEDMICISCFQELSENAKKLYIRMFSRKLNWIPLSKLNYPEIADDLLPYLQELIENGLIFCDDNLFDLEEVLNALSAPDIKSLAKSYHMVTAVSQKGQLVQELLKKCQQMSTITSMFGSNSGGVAKKMLLKAKKFLNGIYKLRPEPRKVFVRVMMLFSVVNTSVDEDSGNGGQGQLFQMLMVNMGKVIYPSYTVDKVHNIFQEREDVIRFEEALQLESDLLHCTLRGSWDKAYEIYLEVEEKSKLLEANESITKWNNDLPDFLRCYTASSVINRLLSIGVEILQRRKNFPGAVDLLRRLLAQTTYNCSHRGYWWERLALNLDAHLKEPLESLDAVAQSLSDGYVRIGHRYALYLRAESICQRPRLKLNDKLQEFHHETVEETPKVYIEGRVLHQGVSTNGTKFLTEESYADGNSEDMTVCGVEEYVMGYYKKKGYPSGIHAEGSIVSTLFGLFFWDIIFMTLPDAFHSPFQALPLDLYSDSFYSRRKDVIEERLVKLAQSSVEELQILCEETWSSHEGSQCVGLGWERVRSLESVKEIIACMGGNVLSGLLARHARCPRHTRSGFPDLTLWNPQTGALKICEVKGPGDRLSHKQILWIDYLIKLGVDAEVCHVKAVAAKKLRPGL